ncbi:TetR/AcrR family transcriptional regulator [Nocardioides albus]|uniref:AcrR family transcriptional regulator n=1 Tax=Nocardioides albus TaxID=1841 RepID=A0A7W5A8A1_9ACTN|nr:TetR/AcrR family transcriptional regulator [Nocardioides albus]MBB3091205.1 AcrR family transcriptional regulator [Nocardioides albus]GGU33605.1 TetR family transcriptional regulator [Nocardioides albus]
MTVVEDRRSRRTRGALRDALVSLVLERGYAAVTVEDIVAAADVGRATFYTHFKDKEALYDDVVASVLRELKDRLAEVLAPEDAGFTGQPVAEVFRHASERPDAYRMILRGEGDGRGLRAFEDAWSTAAHEIFSARVNANAVRPRVDLQVLARAWVGEQVAVLLWWLDAPEPRPATDQVVKTLVELSRRGRLWATGFDPEGR